MSSNQNPFGATAGQLESQEQNINQQQTATGQQNQNTAQNSLSQFEGPVTQTPMYQSLLTSGIEGTSNAYNNAQANQRQTANQAGYGYTQPAEQAAEGSLQAQEAGALASQPGKAYQEAAPLDLQATQDTANLGSTQVGEGGTAANTALTANQQQSNIWGQNQQAQQNFFNSLTSALSPLEDVVFS
jgi:hypothetical protein